MKSRTWFLATALLASSLGGNKPSRPRRPLEAPPATLPARGSKSSSASPSWKIITWASNTEAWNRKLHVTGYRIGCGSEPQQCIHRGEVDVSRDGIRNIYISMPFRPGQSPAAARSYSALSRTVPFVAEAGFDDFVDRDQRLLVSPDPDIPGFLRRVVRNVGIDNPHLKFGITLYEDEMNSPYIRPPLLPASVARQVGYVHLYLHYRADAPLYPRYVQETRRLFPNAQILAGSYAYDRVDYIPCSPASHDKCTPKQDEALFLESLRIQANLLREGRIAGIEFYPGFFGKETEWPHWKEADICAPARRRQCLADTVAMRQAAVGVLDKILQW